ncbi:MAG: MATE family efflux transporter [Solobacterium sp.]|nr:MATE family efflux transporter [Solobacterium sp.]
MANERILKEAPVWKLIISLSLPVILIMIVNVVYNMADVFFISRTGDPNQIAGISLASPVFSAVSAFNTLIGFGGCTAVSIALGRQEEKKVREYTCFVLYGSFLLSLILMAVLFAGMPVLLRLLGTDQATAPFCEAYLRIIIPGAPFLLVSGALGNTMRADGDVKSVMVWTMAGTLMNIALDPLLISVLHMGVKGAAAATAAGNIASSAGLLILSMKKDYFSLNLKDFTLRPDVSLYILSLGLPMAAGTLLMSFSSAFGNNLAVKYGTQVIAARSIAGKIGMLSAMIIMGLCMGMQPAISYNHGADNRQRMMGIIRGTLTAATVTAVATASFIWLARDPFMRAFIDNEEIIALGKRFILGSVLSAPVYGLYQMCSTYLQATGKVTAATFVSLLRQGIVLIPVLYLMENLFGLNGLIFTSFVTDLTASAIAVMLSVREEKPHLQKHAEAVEA